MSDYDDSVDKAREYTQEEIQDAFMSHLSGLIRYWKDIPGSDHYKLWGLAHSFLVSLDGVSCGLPAFEIIPSPCPGDKEDLIEEGENYYPEPNVDFDGVVTVHGGQMLHDLLPKYAKPPEK